MTPALNLQAFLAGCLLLTAAPAQAQPRAMTMPVACWPDQSVIKGLADQYHEALQPPLGLTKHGGVLAATVSEAGTWTLLVSFPDGRTCVLDSGTAWQGQYVAPKGPPA